jgi:hypothetical protein
VQFARNHFFRISATVIQLRFSPLLNLLETSPGQILTCNTPVYQETRFPSLFARFVFPTIFSSTYSSYPAANSQSSRYHQIYLERELERWLTGTTIEGRCLANTFARLAVMCTSLKGARRTAGRISVTTSCSDQVEHVAQPVRTNSCGKTLGRRSSSSAERQLASCWLGARVPLELNPWRLRCHHKRPFREIVGQPRCRRSK